MSIAGNIVVTTAKVPLVGRTAFQLGFSPLDISACNVNIYVLDDPSDALTAAIITHAGTDAHLSVTDVEVEFTAPEAALLSAQRLFPLVAVVSDASTAEVLYVTTASLMPVRNGFYGQFTATLMQPVLNSAYVNRLAITAYAGGTSGCLDFITTADKTLGTIIEFVLTTGAQPEQWVLEAGVNTTDAGATQNGTDYNASTNARFWRRCM
jgi:hypothetical protein